MLMSSAARKIPTPSAPPRRSASPPFGSVRPPPRSAPRCAPRSATAPPRPGQPVCSQASRGPLSLSLLRAHAGRHRCCPSVPGSGPARPDLVLLRVSRRAEGSALGRGASPGLPFRTGSFARAVASAPGPRGPALAGVAHERNVAGAPRARLVHPAPRAPGARPFRPAGAPARPGWRRGSRTRGWPARAHPHPDLPRQAPPGPVALVVGQVLGGGWCGRVHAPAQEHGPRGGQRAGCPGRGASATPPSSPRLFPSSTKASKAGRRVPLRRQVRHRARQRLAHPRPPADFERQGETSRATASSACLLERRVARPAPAPTSSTAPRAWSQAQRSSRSHPSGGVKYRAASAPSRKPSSRSISSSAVQGRAPASQHASRQAPKASPTSGVSACVRCRSGRSARGVPGAGLTGAPRAPAGPGSAGGTRGLHRERRQVPTPQVCHSQPAVSQEGDVGGRGERGPGGVVGQDVDGPAGAEAVDAVGAVAGDVEGSFGVEGQAVRHRPRQAHHLLGGAEAPSAVVQAGHPGSVDSAT